MGLPSWRSLPLAGLVMMAVYGLLIWALDAEARALARSAWGQVSRRGRALLARRSAGETKA